MSELVRFEQSPDPIDDGPLLAAPPLHGRRAAPSIRKPSMILWPVAAMVVMLPVLVILVISLLS